MYPEFKKNELILFLFLLVAISIIFIEKTQAKIVLIFALVGLIYPDKVMKTINNKKPRRTIEEKPTEDDLAEMPEDPFNTYKDDYLDNSEYDRITYRAFAEYPEDVAKHINPIYDQRNMLTSADDRCAQMSRTSQMRSKEAIDNRVKFNINSIRPYYEEDLVSTENAPWWGDNDKFFM